MSDVLMDLHSHYKAVRARLNAGPPPKPVEIEERAPEPVKTDPEPPPVGPLTMLGYMSSNPEMMRGLVCSPEAKERIFRVLRKHGISWRDACKRSQRWKYAQCRFEIYAQLNAYGWSLSQIGRLCGKRDHTTVLSGIRRFIKQNMTEGQIEMCKIFEMRPVVYCVEMMRLKESRDER